jgi:HSP20 family molecular chaperone IbpA
LFACPGHLKELIDIAGDSNGYEINLDVPGLTEPDLSLEVKDDVIGDEIRANLEKGVLRMEPPRRETATREVKRISINS